MAPRILPIFAMLLASVFALGFVSSPCRAASPKTGADLRARQAIQAIYNEQDRAAQHKDLGGVFAQTAPDFLAIDQDGQMITLAQAKANIAQLFSEARSVKSTTTITKFHLNGRLAVATAKSRDVVVYTDPNTGRSGTLTIDDLAVDTWVRTGKGWLQTRSHDIAQTVHRNLAPAPPTYNPLLS